VNEGTLAADRAATAFDSAASGAPAGENKVSRALELARRVARASGKTFAEANYDTEARRPVQMDASLAGLARMRVTGVQPEDLYFGRPVAELVAAYEAWVESAVRETAEHRMSKEQGAVRAQQLQDLQKGLQRESDAAIAAASGAEAGASGGASASAAAAPALDSGERRLENAYIDYCVSSEQIEALYYALLRKGGRLALGVKEGRYPQDALARFDATWGDWVAAVETAIEGGELNVTLDSRGNLGFKEQDKEGEKAVEAALAGLDDVIRLKREKAAGAQAQDDLTALDGSAAAGMALDDRNLAAGLNLKKE
jgi:hypothetical protein